MNIACLEILKSSYSAKVWCVRKTIELMVVASVRVNMLCQVSSTIASEVITKNWLVTHQMAPAVSIIKIFDISKHVNILAIHYC